MNNTLRWTPGASAAEQVEHAYRAASRLVSQTFAGFSRQAANRRALHELSALPERDLRDIGLSRWDVLDAEAVADTCDSSQRLLAHRDERLQVRRTITFRC